MYAEEGWEKVSHDQGMFYPLRQLDHYVAIAMIYYTENNHVLLWSNLCLVLLMSLDCYTTKLQNSL